MPKYDFDTVIERRGTQSVKWTFFDEDVLPLWVADMDFVSPPAIMEALHQRVDHGIFGYTFGTDELGEVVANRMQERFDWDVQPDEMVFVPGLVLGLNLVQRALTKPGDGIVINTPVYGPFFSSIANNQAFAQRTDLQAVSQSQHTIRYEIDFDDFEKTITSQTSMYLCCNPHNPTGRVFTRDELEKLAAICEKHDLMICSDEIHSDLLFDDNVHIPMASLSPEISQRTVTLIAPSKTFNIAGLGGSVIICQNKEWLQNINQTMRNLGSHCDALSFQAMLAAYQYGDDWLEHLLVYLDGNRQYVVDYVRDCLPGVKTTVPEGTYLAWLDCSGLSIGNDAYQFFLDEAKVALNPAVFFGSNEPFVRINFGCPRATLQEALERMKTAIKKIQPVI